MEKGGGGCAAPVCGLGVLKNVLLAEAPCTFFQKGARRLYEMPIFCHHQSCFLQNRKTMPFVGRLVAGLLWPFGRPRQSPTRPAEPSAKACPEDPCKTPQGFCTTSASTRQGNRPRMPPGFGQDPIRIPQETWRGPPGNMHDFPKVGRHQTSRKDFAEHPKHSERLHQELSKELTQLPPATCKIAKGHPNEVVKYCPKDLGTRIIQGRRPTMPPGFRQDLATIPQVICTSAPRLRKGNQPRLECLQHLAKTPGAICQRSQRTPQECRQGSANTPQGLRNSPKEILKRLAQIPQPIPSIPNRKTPGNAPSIRPNLPKNLTNFNKNTPGTCQDQASPRHSPKNARRISPRARLPQRSFKRLPSGFGVSDSPTA